MTNEAVTKPELKELMNSEKEASNKDIIEKCIGAMNRWQIWICFVLVLCKFPIAWHQLSILVIAPPPVFSCADNFTDKCSPNCSSIIFDRSVFTETIQTQWNLVCDRAQLANLAQAVVMFGILVGNLIFGILADKYGRKLPLTLAIILQLAAGVSIAFIPWFWMFLVFRFISAVATGGTLVTSFVLVMELVGAKWRTPLCTLYQIPFNIGHSMLALIGYNIHDWRHIQLAISLPSVILISYYWILPESPRWLLTTGQPEKAVVVMEKAARFNKLPQNLIKGDVDSYMQKSRKETSKGNFGDLVRTSNMRLKTVCICFNWMTTGLCFYGGAQYMGQLGGNMFVNIALSALVQIPGTICSIWFMQFFGRRRTLLYANIAVGLSFLVVAFIPENLNWAKVLLGTVAMYAISLCYCTLYIYAGELYPTVIRNIGVGTASMFARLGSIIAPYVACIAFKPWVCPVIFGSAPLMGAILCYYLPETLNCKLPDTLEDAESLERNVKSKKRKSTTVTENDTKS